MYICLLSLVRLQLLHTKAMADCGKFKIKKKNPTQHIEKFTNSKVPLIFKWTKAYSKSMRSWDSHFTCVLVHYRFIHRKLYVCCIYDMVSFEWNQWLLFGFWVDLNNFLWASSLFIRFLLKTVLYMMPISTCSRIYMVVRLFHAVQCILENR